MTEDWRTLRKKRRRSLCRRVHRTILVAIGLSVVVCIVAHIIWFRIGWTDLQPRCTYGDQVDWRVLVGELKPDVANSFETTLKALYGKAAVSREGQGHLRVRPAVLYLDDHGRLEDLTAWLTSISAASLGSQVEYARDANDCDFVQHYLMADGKAAACEDRWHARLVSIFDQDSWPWLTRFFWVQQPAPEIVEGLPWSATLYGRGSVPHVA